MKTKIDLQQFCITNKTRLNIAKPFSVGDYTYATDGCIIIEVPRLKNVGEVNGSPKVDYVMAMYPSGEKKYSKLPDLPKWERVQCKTCDGNGTRASVYGHGYDCETCRGRGEERFLFDLGKQTFDLKYLHLIAKLPKLEIVLNVNGERDVMPFRFDGGRGLLMPVRK